MAPPGKFRSKRSSSSYSSTLTTVGFIALCVFGVWILTSDSIVPPDAVLIQDPATTQQDPNPKEKHKPDEVEPDQTVTNPDHETRAADEEISETNTAATTANPESKEEEIRQPENQNQDDRVELSNQNQNHMVHGNLYREEFEQREHKIEEVRQERKEATGNWNRNDEDHQRQSEHKQEAEKQQQLRDEAEQQLNSKLPEANQKVEESEAQMAHEEHQKKQAELHNMMSKEEQHKAMQQQQQKSDHRPDGHEFSDQTKNLDANYADNSKSEQLAQIEESKQKEESGSNSWSTQEAQSEASKGMYGYTWQLCNIKSGHDYIPCLDNDKALQRLATNKHYEHRERHCPEEPPTCLVPLPRGYKMSITWPQSRDKIWYHNVPHSLLAEYKGHQNWVKVSGEFSKFPGGGTQFIHGAHYYIDFLQWAVPDIAWGKHTRVTLDVGCGVASFGGYLFDKDVLTMSFAPKDEHEAQVQFALERGIPAISAVMGSQRLPFPSSVFDLVHCARCRVPWHIEGGRLLLELNRILRPGGYFVWSATPVYLKKEEDKEIWNEMSALTKSMCLELVTIKRNKINKIAAAIYRKPRTNDCYEKRKHKSPPMCNDDDANAAWYVPLQSCMHPVPVEPSERGSQWPEEWPTRLQTPPYWLNDSQMGIYGKPAPQDFSRDYVHWKRVVERSYMKGLGIDWSNVRNVMDLRAVYGGFAAALKDMKLWVLNVVNTDSPDTLPIIYERGLFGIYHDWCESFSSYPRSYDLLHADHLFSKVKKRCKIPPLVVEMDRLLRPGGKLIVRDEPNVIREVENLLKSLHWEVHLIFSKNQQGLLSAQKTDRRPDTYASEI